MTSMIVAAPSRVPARIVHTVAVIGVIFWLGMVIDALMGGFEGHLAQIIVLAVVLGGAHVLVSYFTTKQSIAAIWFTWFIFVGDSLLGIFVNPKAFILAGATVILLVAGYKARSALKG